ncbi:MAG TPA: hypothetical protein VEA63_10910, partial [Opitutus sp.]|nr:hypothetical protein [Opitutus sp.]
AAMTDVETGAEVELGEGRVRFKDPLVRPQRAEHESESMNVAFATRKAAEEWMARQKASGADVRIVGEARKVRYFPGTQQKSLKLGGDADGLRAIGYIGQTFFAHVFQEEARRSEMQAFKDYTLKGAGADLVWWEFGCADTRPNAFAFGHRVIVGLDAESGHAYCRISLFSALDFAMILARLPIEASRAVVTDIDPLAKSPPNDIVVTQEASPLGAVAKPTDTKAGLSAAISTGAAQRSLEALMRRLIDYERQNAAVRIADKVNTAASLSAADQENLFAGIADEEAQRVLSLMGYAADDLTQRASSPLESKLADFMRAAVERDPYSDNGLTANASEMLGHACQALAKQMYTDYSAGALDAPRIVELFGTGNGAHIVATALSEVFVTRLMGGST